MRVATDTKTLGSITLSATTNTYGSNPLARRHALSGVAEPDPDQRRRSRWLGAADDDERVHLRRLQQRDADRGVGVGWIDQDDDQHVQQRHHIPTLVPRPAPHLDGDEYGSVARRVRRFFSGVGRFFQGQVFQGTGASNEASDSDPCTVCERGMVEHGIGDEHHALIVVCLRCGIRPDHPGGGRARHAVAAAGNRHHLRRLRQQDVGGDLGHRHRDARAPSAPPTIPSASSSPPIPMRWARARRWCSMPGSASPPARPAPTG